MGFPLAPDAFPQLEIAPQDQIALEALVDALVADTLHESSALRQFQDAAAVTTTRATLMTRPPRLGALEAAHHVDARRWRLLKHRDSVRVYKERSRFLHRRYERSLDSKQQQHAPHPRPSAVLELDPQQEPQPPTLPMMIGIGSVQGCVDDVLYGLLAPTQEAAQIRASYAGDDVVDTRVLATLARPSAAAPLRSLSVQWSARRQHGVCRSLVRLRDFVVVEATGTTTSDSGERVGYHVVHSAAVPGVRELHELNVVRARISMCCVFRPGRSGDGTVEVFMRGFLNPLGDVRLSAAMASAAEPVLSLWRTVRCAQMKKLAWEAACAALRAGRGTRSAAACEICWKPQRASLHALKRCHVCRRHVCSRCCVPKRLHFLSPPTPERHVVRLGVLFCSGCVFSATQRPAAEFAVRESDAVEEALSGVPAMTPASTTASSARSRAFTSPRSDRSCASSAASSYYAAPPELLPSTPMSRRGSRLSRWFQ
ncbi:hypothetical protein PybrP1_001203 [[Pythium] brassicae (nom. inval.)]|nr:hypothetical protein PybrP1_001203 [[Pythium] brassicae (nom. inval.)]